MTSLEEPSPKPLNRSKAWACAAINQLAFPGMGTIMAGRRIGYIQAALMLVGFVLAMGFMLWFIYCAALSLANSGADQKQFVAQYRPYAWVGKSGLGLCVLAWCWSLLSTIAILRQSRKTPPPFPVT